MNLFWLVQVRKYTKLLFSLHGYPLSTGGTMGTLEQALLDHELIVLRVIGEWWELDLTGADKPKSAKALVKALTDLSMPDEVSYLSPEEAAAINRLVLNKGRLPVATFSREFGEVRQMGP